MVGNSERGARTTLSPPEAGLVMGVIVGVADVVVHERWSHLQIAPLEPLAIIFTWLIVCCTAGLMCSSARLGRLRWVALSFAGPGILLLSRASTPFKQMTGWPSSRVLLAWLAATAIIAIALSFIPLAKTRHSLRYGCAMLLGMVILVFAAADIPIAIMRSPAAQAPSNARNVLLIFLDTTRADDALETSAPAMPHLAAFASNATNFTSAWAPASWTIPSHFAVFTGANWWRVPSHQEGVFSYDGPRLAEQFQSRGYQTAAIFANPILTADAGFSKGFDEFTISRGSSVCQSGVGELLYRVVFNDGPRMSLCGTFIASEVTARALRYIGRAHRPYLLAVNYLDMHDPYYVPPECRPSNFQRVPRAYRDALVAANPELPPPSASIVSRAHAQYRMTMSCTDRSLGLLLDAASRDPNTVIAVVGDHGEEFLEHGHGSHGFDIYRETIRVPLVLRVPGVPPQTVDTPVSTTDLYASLLRAAGMFRTSDPLPLLDPAKRRKVVSMFELLRAPNDPSSMIRGYSVVSGDYQFIFWPQNGEALYDYRNDPAESHPLSLAALLTVAGPMRDMAVRAARDKQRALQFSAVGYMR